ncbi:Putative THO complex, subunit THOC1 protein [Septoria linicola]|uniref:THO complex, subunit THOC1 protein n=1 Tax=Septoria linicola TaxID=215465 RepID=A0A9Q9AU93_9PEZI|nr:Putative THO complex, subunit THOC1 protein [Septoria linicola]
MAVASATELQPVASITNRLRDLLQQAKVEKPESTVEPALPVSSLSDSVAALHDDIDPGYDQGYRFAAVEAASREIFYSFVHSTNIDDPAFGDVWNLLDIVLMCGDKGKCTPELICWLLEELLDSQTTIGCRTVFDYLDSRRERLAQKDFHKKNLVFLRSCNELLRRLSRAEDAIFCGRVFFFLFQTFPLGDKSSVNLRGEFHVENTTKFDVEDGANDQMQVDTELSEATSFSKENTPQPVQAGKPGSKAVPIKPPKKTTEEAILSTNELYPIFWRLQHDFSDPTRLFERANFELFKKGLASTLIKFKKTPTVVQTKAGEEDKRGTKRKLHESGNNASSDHLLDNYNPKYLTSRDLFDLELSDLAFQRHILVQAMILIDFLLSLTDRVKKRLATLTATNKSLLYAFTLSEEDTQWALSTRSAIRDGLESRDDGRQYCRMVETVLTRDKNWVRWKVESCPSIVRGPVTTEEELQARKNAATFTRPRRIPDKPQSTMDLVFLDESSSGGLDALKDAARFTTPSIEQLVDQIKMEKLDAEMAMTDDEKTNIETAIMNAKWRALRDARATELALLDKVESTKDLEDILSAPDASAVEVESAEHNGDDPSTNLAASDLADVSAVTDVTAAKSEPVPIAEAEDKVMGGIETK